MKINQLMFLYAVEEMSFTRAAQRACVTQQCLSSHISRLEQQYGTKLFNRSPRLSLTSAGEALYKAFTQIKRIEENIAQELSSDSRNIKGTLVMGIPSGRAQVIIPNFFAAYRQIYPNITLNIVLGQTEAMSGMLKNGTLDLFLGVSTAPAQDFDTDYILDDEIYLVATEEFLTRHLGSWKKERQTISPEEISSLPLALNPEISTVKRIVLDYLTKYKITPNVLCEIADYSTKFLMCQAGQIAFFSPSSLLLQNSFQNSQKDIRQRRIIPLRPDGMTITARIELVRSKNHYLPKYVEPLRKVFVDTYRANYRQIHDFLSSRTLAQK